jgi:hypothetical protein
MNRRSMGLREGSSRSELTRAPISSSVAASRSSSAVSVGVGAGGAGLGDVCTVGGGVAVGSALFELLWAATVGTAEGVGLGASMVA